MAQLCTLGEPQVIPGHGSEPVAAWRDLGAWTEATAPGSTWAKLLQDRDDPQRFVSFGPWRDDTAVRLAAGLQGGRPPAAQASSIGRRAVEVSTSPPSGVTSIVSETP